MVEWEEELTTTSCGLQGPADAGQQEGSILLQELLVVNSCPENPGGRDAAFLPSAARLTLKRTGGAR